MSSLHELAKILPSVEVEYDKAFVVKIMKEGEKHAEIIIYVDEMQFVRDETPKVKLTMVVVPKE
jgi:thymidine kinase